MSVKECLISARYKLGMNQREFAEFLEINKASVSLYEMGIRNPSFPAMRRIVDKLKAKNIEIEYSDFREDK